MHTHTPSASVLICALVTALIAVPAIASFDRKALRGAGEDYVIALHDSYAEAAKKLQDYRYPEVPKFFRNRVVEIEKGEELFPANPTDFPISDELMRARVAWAYEETYEVTTSEAADAEPYLVAYVQIAYEQWLITMHCNPRDIDREKLAEAFDRRLDALTSSPRVAGSDHRTIVVASADP